MSRHPLIEALHEARYDLETGAIHEQGELRRKLDGLVAQAIAQSTVEVTAHQVLDLIYDDYRDFRKMKRRQEWPKV